MDNQLTIHDLPVECVEEIMKWITSREDRIYARFVCKMWCALIDQDCTTEYYLIVPRMHNPLYRNAIINNADDVDSIPVQRAEFSKMFSVFLNSQRKKTSFYFDFVDFRKSEQFWRMKGKCIITLYFGHHCYNVPLREIIEHCFLLKTVTFTSMWANFGGVQKFIDVLENCVADGKTNSSVRFLCFKQQCLDDVIAVVRLVSQVFIGIQKVIFDEVQNDLKEFDWVDKVNSFSTSFQNLKFLITLSNYEATFIFDPSGKVPVKMTRLKIDLAWKINIPWNKCVATHLSRYSWGQNHLNKLDLVYQGNMQYRLDAIHELFTQCPSLKLIDVSIKMNDSIPLTNPLSKNNIKYLSFNSIHRISFIIDDVFLQSFENLRTFKCGKYYKLNFSHFVKLLSKLPHLEKLKISEGIIDVDPEQTISNGKLCELRIPKLFLLRTIAKYDFSNLRKLKLCRNQSKSESNHLSGDLDEHLKRMNCPKLEILQVSFDTRTWKNDHDKFVPLIMNISAFFPVLTEFLLLYPDEEGDYNFEITDDSLKTILVNHRKLKIRVLGHRSDPHILRVLSPSHINRRSDHRESVIVIP